VGSGAERTRTALTVIRFLAGCPGADSAQAGRGASCQGCPNQRLCASGAGAAPDPGEEGARPEQEVTSASPEEAGLREYRGW
jgi:hypothetical protein